MRASRVLIKLGGASLQDHSVMKTLAEALKTYRHFGYEVIVVHGGGPAINAELTRRNISWTFVQGQRVTTPEMMDVVEMVLRGHVNSRLVKFLNAEGLFSLGFSGTDGNLLACQAKSLELGLVGNIEEVNGLWVEEILKLRGSPIPVIAPLGVGQQGETYNINADWAAAHLAIALKAQYLVFLTDQRGVLDAQNQLIERLTISDLNTLIANETVKDGMLTKTKTILYALENGLQGVRVMNGHDAVQGVWSDRIGTWCSSSESISDSKAETSSGKFI